MTSIIGNYLVKADNISDYVPVVSTVTNLIDLFQKYVVLPRMNVQSVESSHYYTHLSQKSFSRCLVLLIPGLGNFFVGVYDFINRKYDNKDFMLQSIKSGMGATIKDASVRLKDDPDFMYEAHIAQVNYFKANPQTNPKDPKELKAKLVLNLASNRLKNNLDFISRFYKAGYGFGAELEYLVGDKLKGDSTFMAMAIANNIETLPFTNLKNDMKFMLTVFPEKQGSDAKRAFIKVCREVRLTGDKTFMTELVKKDKGMYWLATEELKKDPEFRELVLGPSDNIGNGGVQRGQRQRKSHIA